MNKNHKKEFSFIGKDGVEIKAGDYITEGKIGDIYENIKGELIQPAIGQIYKFYCSNSTYENLKYQYDEQMQFGNYFIDVKAITTSKVKILEDTKDYKKGDILEYHLSLYDGSFLAWDDAYKYNNFLGFFYKLKNYFYKTIFK